MPTIETHGVRPVSPTVDGARCGSSCVPRMSRTRSSSTSDRRRACGYVLNCTAFNAETGHDYGISATTEPLRSRHFPLGRIGSNAGNEVEQPQRPGSLRGDHTTPLSHHQEPEP